MNKISTFFSLIIFSLALACGGGGGGGSGASTLTYSGNSDKASLTTMNSTTFVSEVFSGFGGGLTRLKPSKEENDSIFNVAEKVQSKIDGIYSTSNIRSKEVISNSWNGLHSGSLTFDYNYNDENGSIVNIVYVFSNYSDDGKNFLDGKHTYNMTFSNDTKKTARYIIMERMTFTYEGASYFINGTYSDTTAGSLYPIISKSDFLVTDLKSNKSFILDSTTYETSLYNYTVAMGSKIYHSDYGYVDIQSIDPSVYTQVKTTIGNNVRSPFPVSGKLLLTGNNGSRIYVTENNENLKVEIDLNFDGLIESTDNLILTDLKSRRSIDLSE